MISQQMSLNTAPIFPLQNSATRLLRVFIRTRDFSRASSELQVIARNCDWFMALFAPAVIGGSNCFGFGFPTVI